MVWWDVRLQPRLGTIELRELDVQARLDEAAGDGRAGARAGAAGGGGAGEHLAPAETLAWSCFRAARDGSTPRSSTAAGCVPLREAARETLARARGGEDPRSTAWSASSARATGLSGSGPPTRAAGCGRCSGTSRLRQRGRWGLQPAAA